MPLIEELLAAAETRGDAAAIVAPGGRTATFSALAHDSARRAQAYADAGIGPRDVVLVLEGVSASLYASLLALFRLGAVALFPEPAAGLAGVRHAVAAARPKAIAGGARARLARALEPDLARLTILPTVSRRAPRADGPLAKVDPEAPALVTFTSGSTGRPKGIVRSRSFLLLQHRLIEAVRATTPEDVDLISLPMFILSNLAAGATSVIPAGDLRRPGAMDGARLRGQIALHAATRVVAPPALCARLAEAPAPGLRAVFTGGGPVFPNLWRALRAAAPAARLCAIYGSTEAEPIAHVDWDEIADTDWAAMAEGAGLLAGRPVPEAKLEIRDGEIEVAGAHVNRGYLDPADDAETKTVRDGELWHRTGDGGRLDAQGRLWLLGRATAAVDGLHPFAVETAALSWPGVRQAALVAESGRARLAVAGAGLDLEDIRRRAGGLGVPDVVALRAIPTDRRHNSKIDYARLRARLA